MYTLKLELSGGYKSELPPMDGDALLALLDDGMMGARPYAVIVNGVEVDWPTFKAIFNLGMLAEAAPYRPTAKIA